MAHKTKAARAAYMRKWRERQKSGSAGGGEVGALSDSGPAPAPIAASPPPPAPDFQTPAEFAAEHADEIAILTVLPTFLAAPVDECPICHHDRQENDHLGGRPCKFKTSPRRNCGCIFEGF